MSAEASEPSERVDARSQIDPKPKPKPKPKFKKRVGAKAAKAFERVDATNKNGALSQNGATTFRAISARGNYLAQDRPDASFASKELCRDFSQPNAHSLQKLKRLGRFYAGRPRLVYKYRFAQRPATHIDVFCDTDVVGFTQSRRSTSGGCALIGTACIKHWSKTQPTVTLSSGEAELVGLGQGIAQALGLRSLAADTNWPLQLNVHTDATAAIGIAKRRGLGKVRHLHTTDLWVQETVRNGDVALHNVLGAENPADIFTKYLDRTIMEAAMKKLDLHYMPGRAKAAPDTMGLRSVTPSAQ